MEERLGILLAAVFLLGIGAQWIAWRIRTPAILLLLLFGLGAGPFTGFLKPDEVFGQELLLQIVQFSVGVILFEGGMSLRFSEVKKVGGTVLSLVTLGMLVSWGVSTVAARFILNFDWSLSMLIGAVLVVTGPTVVGPLLRQIRPKKTVASVLKWEGIVIDPVGVLLAVLVYESAFLAHGSGPAEIIGALLKTLFVGFGLGLTLAALLVLFLRRFWIPEFLHSPFVLMTVIGSFVASNLAMHESGLLTVTVLGIALANQKFVKVDHILHFKENLQVLLISSLFILLAARIDMSTLQKIGSQSVFFLLVLILIGRPLAVFISTAFSKIQWRERVFLACLAPRGIVAAASAAVFALRLEESGNLDASLFVPNVFLVIMGTVLIYGLAALPLARKLNLTDINPQGVLFIGANEFARGLAEALSSKGFKVLLVDANRNLIRRTRAVGLPVIQGNVLSERTLEEADLEGIGKVFAMTPNSEVNSLALVHLAPQFTNERSYHLPISLNKNTAGDTSEVPESLAKRTLFGDEYTYERLDEMVRDGGHIKVTNISAEFTWESFKEEYNDRAILLAVITENNHLEPVSLDYKPKVKAGASVVTLVMPSELV
ncbi:MAG: cation:proton antiporter [Fimbriimonadaceae bacterium]